MSTFKEKLKGWEGSASKLDQEIPWSDNLPLVDKKHANHRVAGGSKHGLYYDSVGKLTAGYGHLVRSEDSLKDMHSLSPKDANRLFDKDLAKHDKDAQAYFKEVKADYDKAPDSTKNLVRSMAFNLGGPKLRSWTGLGGELAEEDKAGIIKQSIKSKRWTQIGDRGPQEVQPIRDELLEELKPDDGDTDASLSRRKKLLRKLKPSSFTKEGRESMAKKYK